MELNKTDKEKYDKYILFLESNNKKLSDDEKKYIMETWEPGSMDGKYSKYNIKNTVNESTDDMIKLDKSATIDDLYELALR